MNGELRSNRKLVLTESRRRVIFDRTHGHCHFCGDLLAFELRGKWHGSGRGAWEADHVFQLGRGGEDVVENYLPACSECNRARWFHGGSRVRRLIALGIVADSEISKNSQTGLAMAKALEASERKNASRRKLPPAHGAS